MRYRKPANYMEKLSQYSYYLSQDKAIQNKGKWRERFPNNNQLLMIEIGCGKGGFLVQMARKFPDINFIGIERTESLLLDALCEIDQQDKNIIFCGFHARFLSDIFAQEEVQRIYLNFSDPWPKKRNAKRRLTHRNFLEQYSLILGRKKELFFKTDNVPLFEFTVMELSARGDRLQSLDIDLHSASKKTTANEWEEKFIMTEYEKKFTQNHIPIYRLEADLK